MSINTDNTNMTSYRHHLAGKAIAEKLGLKIVNDKVVTENGMKTFIGLSELICDIQVEEMNRK